MTAPRLLLACSLCALVVSGCNSQRPPPSPARFEQPNAVDFVCVRNDKITKLADCANNQSDEDALVPFAVVTQHARGEIAAVDLEEHRVIDSRRDIPGYTFTAVGEHPIAVVVPSKYPEFTYVADFGSHDVRVLKTSALVLPLTTKLGEPVSVQTVPLSLTTPQGSVALAPTQMALAPDQNALIVAVPEQGSVLWLPIQRCDESSAAGCMDGHIDVAGMASIKLEASADLIEPPSGEAPRNEYQKLCGFERPEPAPAESPAIAAGALEHAPRPSGFAVDAFCFGSSKCQRRLLVSDEALPLIHVIDIDKIEPGMQGSEALLPPIVTGVPTRGVAVTPKVPKAIDSDEATQYVYAIDAVDGSVLVTENGHVLNLDAAPAPRPNRIQFDELLSVGAPAASALTVLTPYYRTDQPVGQWVDPNPDTKRPNPNKCTDPDHEFESPQRLRGVFLAVAMTDGTVRIVDVHDMELHVAKLNVGAKAPEQSGSCRPCADHPIPALIRNHERLATNFVVEPGEDPPLLTPALAIFEFEAEGLPFPVRADGTSGSPDATGLECFDCSAGFTRVFPLPGTESNAAGDEDAGTDSGEGACANGKALLCATEDPWTLSQEQWIAVWEGHLPATTGGDARFLDPDPALNRPSPEVAGSADFCAAGVIGEDIYDQVYTGEDCDTPASTEHPPSDQLVITAAVPGDDRLKQLDLATAELKRCQDARTAIDEDPTLTFAFKIRRSYRDHLVIGANLLQPLGGLRTYQDLRKCLGDAPMTFDVRARDSFIVVGSEHGFQHRITADASGRCVVESDTDALRRARVRLGCTFRSQTIAWRPRKPDKEDRVKEPPPGLQLAIQVITPAAKLRVNTASLGFGGATVVPTQLRYNAFDRLLYLVDISDRGLVPIGLDPLPAAVDSSATFN